MGDRVLVVFKSEFLVSPAVYLHWGGSSVNDLLDSHDELMKDRTQDPEYSAARFIGICHNHFEGNLSLGVRNCSEQTENFILDPEKNRSKGLGSEITERLIVVDTNNDFKRTQY